MKQRNHCPHIAGIKEAAPNGKKCEECGSDFNLRVCITCGHVGCCESQQAHNTKHAKAVHHPIIKSLPVSDKSFIWCYECNDYLSAV